MKKRAVWQHLEDGNKRLRVLDEDTRLNSHRYVDDYVPVKDAVNVKVTRGPNHPK